LREPRLRERGEIVRRGPLAAWTRLAAVAACSALLACGISDDDASKPRPAAAAPSPTIERYTDLLRLGIHYQTVLSGARVGNEVWDLGGQYRPVLAQGVGRVELGPVPPGDDCRLVVGVARQGGDERMPLRARIALHDASDPDRTIFETELGAPPPGAWIDRVEPLRGAPGQEFRILLEAGPAEGGGARVGWSAPHVICRVARTPLTPLAHPHVLLISLDTLRPDHLGLYGYGRDTSPVLDALAGESRVFDRVFAPASWTLPSHASLFTGVLPAVHGAGHASPYAPLPADGPATIAEQLRDAGYTTIAFTAGGLMSRKNGLDRGFQWWTEQTRANLAATLPGFFDAIGTAPQKPLFLMLHTYDIHGPYGYVPGGDAIVVPPRKGTAAPAPTPPCGGAECGDAEWKRVRAIGYHEYQRFDRFSGVGDAIEAYDRGIRFVDGQLGVLFDRLRDVGIFDSMLIVVTSDHGESLYERGAYFGHSYTLYDEELRVPLIVRLPDRTAARSDALVELTDVAASILDVAGLPHPPAMEGRSLFARDATAERRVVSGEAAHTGQRFARSAGAKWITAWAPGVVSLVPAQLRERIDSDEQVFDVARDPGERHDLAVAGAPEPADTVALQAIVEAAPVPGTDNQKPAPALDAERERQLRELGYLR
jgi:arylsulfatase